MKIGIDFDGTIADTTGTKVRYALEAFGESISPEETFGPVGRGRLGDERYVEMVQAAHRGWTGGTPPMPGALDAMRRLAADHELYVITARTDEEIDHAKDWLRTFSAPARGVMHTARAAKVDACRERGIEFMLDDLPQVLHELAEAGIGTALLEAAYNRDVTRHEQIHLVRTWGDFVALCERVSGVSVADR